jgi:phosphoribosyl 1,2-cyclic phosphate phosphodiesterase
MNAAALLSWDGTNLLIDCGRDFRQQALRFGIRRLDALVVTHNHYDHIAGIDDLRVFTARGAPPMPVYGKPEHLDYLREKTFSYLFDERLQRGGGVASLELRPTSGPFELHGVRFEPLPVQHGSAEIFGYRFLDCAYLSDVSEIPQDTEERLRGLRVLILDGLRYRPHVSHLSVLEAVATIRRLRPERAYLTHMCHDVLHADLAARLRDADGELACEVPTEPAHDGLRITL